MRDVPKSILKEIKVIPVEHMDTVLIHALVWQNPEDAGKKRDELFEKLREITEVEISAAELSFAH